MIEEKTKKLKKNRLKLGKYKSPENWRIIYENIKKMRLEKDATVDEMGAEMAVDKNAELKIFRYQTLIALMLSSQTKDPVTYGAMQRLREFGLTPENIINIKLEDLEKLIYPVAFYKRKAIYLKDATKILISKYNGDIPIELDEMMSLPGVGQKMSHICMKQAWNKVTGIGVDTHVHKVSKRLGWVEDSKDPDFTRTQLESWMPREIWGEVYELFAGFGQQICLSVNPKCSLCLNNKLCPKNFVKKSV